MNVIFADGNKANFNISNLLLVSDAELGTMNKNGLIYKGFEEGTKCGLTIAKIMIRRTKLSEK